MKTSTLRGFLIACALLTAHSGWATMISLEPASQIGMPGDTVFLDLTISGLGDGTAPTLGAFDIDLSFDDAALDFVGGMFGSGLNDPLDPFTSFVQSLTSGVGTINLAEVSLLVTPMGDPTPLDLYQPDSFILATLEFMVVDLDPGSFTVVDFGDYLLGDGFGIELADVDSAEAVILNPSTTIAEPMTVMLLGVGLFGIIATRRFS